MPRSEFNHAGADDQDNKESCHSERQSFMDAVKPAQSSSEDTVRKAMKRLYIARIQVSIDGALRIKLLIASLSKR
jgi:hypothetical protein